MMKVWIVLREIDYEGANVIGVYDTQEKAKQACADAYEGRSRNSFAVHYDYYAWEVK